ncbi:MAG: MFS transporter, partial [Betaproteobacteria bacterium]|nr:MFS transporter [Betaproteobacteria bacterium]
MQATRWPAVWAVFAGGLVAGAYIGKIPPALPVMRDELHLDLVDSGFIATMFNATGMAVGMAVGVLCDRYGHKRLALAGLAVMVIGGVLGAFAWTYAALLASRFVEGVGFILFSVAAPSLMAAAAEVPRDRAKALSMWSAYMPTGGSIALLAAPFAIAAVGWRGLWLILAGFAALGFALVARYAHAPRHGTVASMSLVLESLVRPANWALALLFASYVAQWTSVMIWLPTYLVGERSASVGMAGLATALMVIVNIPGNLAGGWLIAHGVRRGPMAIAACAIMALTSAAMLLPTLPDALRFASMLIFSACAGVIPASI